MDLRAIFLCIWKPYFNIAFNFIAMSMSTLIEKLYVAIRFMFWYITVILIPATSFKHNIGVMRIYWLIVLVIQEKQFFGTVSSKWRVEKTTFKRKHHWFSNVISFCKSNTSEINLTNGNTGLSW